MKVAYSAIGVTDKHRPVHGHVVFDSALLPQPGGFAFSIISYAFHCDNLVYSAAGSGAGQVKVPFGPNPDTVDPGNGVWQMGQWGSPVGVIFQAVDSTLFGYGGQASPSAENYRHLAPRIELCCDFLHQPPYGPFHPHGWLKLIWDPQFVLAPGLPHSFFTNPQN